MKDMVDIVKQQVRSGIGGGCRGNVMGVVVAVVTVGVARIWLG